MTFKDVLKKDFTRGLRKYVSYFLSGWFCVAMFMAYSTLILIKEVSKNVEEYPMRMLFIVACSMIALFSIFFINYSHQNFANNKMKELGTYMVLGMAEKDVTKLLTIETSIISGAAIICGMLTGALFARYFQLIVIKIIDIPNIKYQLSYINFLLTLVIFIVIYGVCLFFSIRKIKNNDLDHIIRGSEKKQSKAYRKRDLYLFLLGIISMIFSGVFILNVAGDNHINSKPWVIILFLFTGYIGMFLVVYHGGKAIITMRKKSKKYYKNMLSINGVDYKYNENIKVILILAILASMIVLLVGSPIALITISSDIAEDGNHDLEYALLDFENIDEKKMENEINNLISSEKLEKREEKVLSYGFDENGEIKPIIPVSLYNKEYKTHLQVDRGEIYNLITTWVPGSNGVAIGSKYKFKYMNNSFTFNTIDSVKGNFDCPNLLKNTSVIIISDSDYNSIKPKLGQVKINMFSFLDDWKNKESLVDDVTKIIGDKGFVNSRITKYKELKKGYSVFLFITGSMCFMFFISTGFVLFFKQYNDIDEEKSQYLRLFNMGISDREVKRSIKAKMAVVYFTPLIGTVQGMFIMYYMASLFGGNNILKVFMSKGILGFVFYGTSQILFYFFLRIKYIKDVEKTVKI